MFSESLTKHLKGFSSGFTELRAKHDADTLLDFAFHRRQNEELSWKSTRVKIIRVHSAVSRGRLMQQDCGSVTLASPLIFFHRESYNNNSPGASRLHLVDNDSETELLHDWRCTWLSNFRTYIHLLTCKIYIVHIDKRLITADWVWRMTDSSSRQRERPTSTNLQQSDRSDLKPQMGALFQDRLADWTAGRNITLTLSRCQEGGWRFDIIYGRLGVCHFRPFFSFLSCCRVFSLLPRCICDMNTCYCLG
jgi:hypothetical protein